MGLEYGLFNHDTKTWFDLGKGPWAVLQENKRFCWSVFGLADLIAEEWVLSGRFDSNDPENDLCYAAWLSCQIFSFNQCGHCDESKITLINSPQNVELIADCNSEHDELVKEYKLIGDRYKKLTIEDKEKLKEYKALNYNSLHYMLLIKTGLIKNKDK